MLLNRKSLLKQVFAFASWAYAPKASDALAQPNPQAQINASPTTTATTRPSPSQSASVVAYKGLSLPIPEFGNVQVPVACWFPANSNDNDASNNPSSDPSYSYKISVRRIGQLLAGWNFIPGLVQRDFSLEPARSGVIDGSSVSLPQSGPVILLAHGYLGSRFDLSRLAESLAAEGFTCVSAEYPESLAASYDRMDGLDRDVVNQALLNYLKTDFNLDSNNNKFGIVGHSLGCGTVLRTGDESWARVMIAGFPRQRDGSPISGNFLSVSSMNDGAVSPSRFGGAQGYPKDIAMLNEMDVLTSLDPIPKRSAILYDRPDAPNHISFLYEGVNDAMIDFLSALLPVAKAFEIPVLDFDRYQESRDSRQTAEIVHPVIVRYLRQELMTTP